MFSKSLCYSNSSNSCKGSLGSRNISIKSDKISTTNFAVDKIWFKIVL